MVHGLQCLIMAFVVLFLSFGGWTSYKHIKQWTLYLLPFHTANLVLVFVNEFHILKTVVATSTSYRKHKTSVSTGDSPTCTYTHCLTFILLLSSSYHHVYSSIIHCHRSWLCSHPCHYAPTFHKLSLHVRTFHCAFNSSDAVCQFQYCGFIVMNQK
jgi:hypothetical protein